ncbi:MAG: hypothetical protein KAT85_11735, partial [candidate division Zixibacteria bacterium]|nr:hypothetical protein [candidate division Zixibacteria bacterium]
DSVTGPGEQYDWCERDEDCGSCKFASVVSSGGTLGCNKPTYWENIVKLYNYKKDSLDYCPHNIFVHFHDGTSDNPAQIPSNQVRPCTQAAIDASHDTIAQRIADCEAKGKKSTVQKMFTNHGADDDGVVLLGTERLSPAELRAMQQKLINACCSLLYDEFTQCYGGDMVDGLEGLDDKGKTEIHANSASPNDAPGTSQRTGGHTYLNAKIAALKAGKSYEEAVRAAEAAYLKYLKDVVRPWRERSIAREEAVRDTLPEGRRRTQMTNQINWKKDVLAKQNGQVDSTGCPSWVRYQFKKYCEWKEIVVAPGGQIRIKFKGSGGCGNVTVWEKQADGTWKRVVIWNWNLPGSYGYEAGNDERVINADSTSTGIFRIHNDNGAFTVTVYSYNNRAYAETPSNAYTYAGFSLGGTDGGGTEFGYHPGGVTTANTDQIGFDLEDSPGWFDYWEGTQYYAAQFSAGENSYWDDMELYINVADVMIPGTLQILCPAATGGIVDLYVDSVGEYTSPLGSIEGPTE